MFKTLCAAIAMSTPIAFLAQTALLAADRDSVTISYADLNLASALGRSILQQRIAFAANVVCGPADQRDLAFNEKVRECRTQTIADAQPSYQAAVNSTSQGTAMVMADAARSATGR